MFNKRIGSLFLFLVIIVLLLQARYPAWSGHMSTDTYVYYNRASYFAEHFNLNGLNGDEYLPGSMLLFIITSAVFFLNKSYFAFAIGFTVVNVLLVLSLAWLYRKFKGEYSILIYAIILLFAGPIIFFRFELLVIFTVLLAFYFWSKRQFKYAAMFLGLGTLIKVYPVILLPYLLLFVYRKKNLLSALKVGLVFFSTIFLFLGVYMLVFQVPFQNILSSLNFHSMKPVNSESVWADILTLFYTITSGNPPQLISAWGINGLDQRFWLVPLWFYNYIWILPLGLLYAWLLKKKDKLLLVFDTRICLVIVLLFLIFSKVLTPQYLLWFMLIVPLLDFKLIISRFWIVNLFISLLAIYLYQYVYPLNYTQFLSGFASPLTSVYFYALMTSHILLIVFLVRLLVELKASNK